MALLYHKVAIYSRSGAKDSEGIMQFTYTLFATIMAFVLPLGNQTTKAKEWGVTDADEDVRELLIKGTASGPSWVVTDLVTRQPVTLAAILAIAKLGGVKDLTTPAQYQIRGLSDYEKALDAVMVPYQGGDLIP